ncbi:MAG: calycin-like domain-containing protein [Bacteroidaceae bacterium]
MKRNLLLTLMVALASSFSLAYAADLGAKVAGTYNGDLSVDVNESGLISSKQNVFIEGTAGNTITFKLNDFSFMNFTVGDIVVPNIPLVQEGDKINIDANQTITITSENPMAIGPSLGDVPLVLKGNITGDVVTVGIDIKLNMEGSEMIIRVDFVGTKIPGSSISQVTITSLSIYPNPTTDFIYVSNIEEGSDYKIYNTSGSLVKAGMLISNAVSVAELSNGIYFVDVNGAKAKFIKE